MKNIIKYIFLFHLLMFCAWTYPSTYTLRGLSVSDGLSDLLVNAIYKDSLGFVWIGTGNSLERFDGSHVKHYPITGSNEKLKRVNVIAEMEDNQLWMGNGMGLWRLNKEQDALELIVPDMINCAVYSLLHDGKGTLYIGSAKGLFLYKKGNLEQILLDKNALSTSNVVTGLSLDEQGMLWMATEKGLHSLRLSDRKVKAYHNVKDGKHVCAFNNITRIGSTIYLGTMDQGIISFDTRSGEFEHFVEVGCNIISSLSSDSKNMLYVGTDGNGVHFIATDRRKVVRTMRHETGDNESLRSNSVYSLLVDRNGMVWIGFYQLGLDYTLYQSDLFETYAFPPYFNSKDMPIRALAIHEHEKLVGSRDGLFYIDEQRNRFKSFQSPEIRSGMIFCILFYEGEYYVGTYGGGMYIFNPERLTIRDFAPDGEPQPFLKGHIFCIKQDAEGNLWIGTSQGVYCYKDGRQVAHYTSSNSRLPEGNVYEIYFDSTRKGWICTENGVCIWDPSSEKLRTDIFPEGFIHKEKIRVVYEDSGHNLYFFPDKGSLFISDLSMNSFRRLQPGTPLEGRDGMFIIEDREKWLWMGTSDGLFHYDKNDNFIPYNFVDGIPSSVFTLCPPVCDAEGNFWFGNSKGLVSLDVARMNRKKHDFYPAKVTDVHINGKPSTYPMVTVGSGISRIGLEPSEKNVTFCFSDFSYTSPAFMSYEYQLEGRDDGWIAITGRSEVTYYDLPSGSYVFKVRRMGEPDSETLLKVEIASVFSGWLAWGIVVAVLLAGGGYYFFGRGKRQAPEQVQVVKEEQSVAVETKSASEEKYKNVKVNSEECRRLTDKLEKIMHKDKLYKHSDLKIADLAAAIDTSAHTLSYLFNQYLERNYYDYINDYRIAEFKRLVNTEEYSKYTLSALAELCGFSSRASFFRYFKKATGITPNEYIRSIGGNNE